MELSPEFLSTRPIDRLVDLSFVRRSPADTVASELSKLPVPTEKTQGQLSDEIIAEVDSLHEPILASGTAAPYFAEEEIICVECWTKWPCGTHKAIYGEDTNSCVHRYRPGA